MKTKKSINLEYYVGYHPVNNKLIVNTGGFFSNLNLKK